MFVAQNHNIRFERVAVKLSNESWFSPTVLKGICDLYCLLPFHTTFAVSLTIFCSYCHVVIR